MLKSYGIKEIKKKVKIKKFFLSGIILSLIILYFLSNIILEVKIIHTDSGVRKTLTEELEKYGLKKYKYRKTYKEITNIKDSILTKYKDTIEWLEIKRVGTLYEVKVVERKLDQNKKPKEGNIVASKNAVLKKIIASKGTIVKNINDYVVSGEVVISEEIKLNEELKGITNPEGTIYGEVWYNITVDYPYYFLEETLTNNSKNVLTFSFLNRNKSLLNFKPYKYYKKETNKLIFNKYLPIYLSLDKQKEILKYETFCMEEECISLGVKVGLDKLKSGLDEDEYIINHKVLETKAYEDKLVINIFVTVYENITEYR